MIIRPVQLQDLAFIEHCAQSSGIGMSHLPRRQDLLKTYIQKSLDSFADDVQTPGTEEYMFVLADHESLAGTCAIYAQTGVTTPFYVYHTETLPPEPLPLSTPKERRLLRLERYAEIPSEIGALYLLPQFRKEGLGKLLSLSRFLFIATHPHRFRPTIIANMRGVIEGKASPFWDGLGRRFIDLPLEEVINLRLSNEEFFAKAMPQEPIYVALLPEEARAAIGATHPHTKAALTMLIEQGFKMTDYIDPADGGPIIRADTKELYSVQESLVGEVRTIATLTDSDAPTAMICNNRLDFRAGYGALLATYDRCITIEPSVAEALELQPGDAVRYLTD